MFNWIKRKTQIAVVKAQAEDLDRFITSLKGLDDVEVAMVVAQATHFRNILEAQGIDVLNPLEAEQKNILITMQINRIIRDAQKGDPSGAVGWMVWLHTIRAATTPENRLKGRAMWRELARGFPHVPDTVEGLHEIAGVTFHIEGYDKIPLGLEYEGFF